MKRYNKKNEWKDEHKKYNKKGYGYMYKVKYE